MDSARGKEKNRPMAGQRPWPMRWVVLAIVLYLLFQVVWVIVHWEDDPEPGEPLDPQPAAYVPGADSWRA